MNKSVKRRGFSLVELVIVVVILGIISAIAVPRISRGAKGAGDSSVRSNLAALRNAIDLYAAEHGGDYPGDDNLAATLLEQLTEKTDISGVTGTAGAIYGPYLRATDFPPLEVGPNKGANDVFLAATGPTVDETKATTGWIYNSVTGQIIANTDDPDENNVQYDTY